MEVKLVALCCGLILAFTVGLYAQSPNVLFICVDDLRPELGCYGNDIVQSPNIDKIANSGVLFENHFVTVPTCGASRFGLLTGMYPRSRAALKNSIIADSISTLSESSRPESFIHHLRRSGYRTTGIGKIAHSADGYVYGYEEERSDQLELPYSFDEFLFNPGKWETGWNAFFAYADGSNRQGKKKVVKPYEAGQVGDDGYPDGLTTELAVNKLKEYAEAEEPFFLSVGFFKPHLPFTAPKKYWDLYDRNEISVSPSPGLPANVNRKSLHESGEFNQYQLGEEQASLDHNLSDEYARKLRHAYYACVSYTDAQIGVLMETLKELELVENTIVVVWGDHGWHLGDDRVWGKHTVFEWALRSAFIISGPGVEKGTVEKVVSTVDIYPTILDLCGVEMPHETDGKTLSPLLENGDSGSWKEEAYSYFRNGISLRTDRYRLTKYFRDEEPVMELYDHETDPFETTNISASNPEIMAKLMPMFLDGAYSIYE